MFKKIIWPSMISISVIMVIVFVIGFSQVILITYGNENVEIQLANSINDNNNQIKSALSIKKVLLVIGDSIASGVGDDRNLGMGERYISQLDFEEKDLYEVVNFSVSGSETKNLYELIRSGEIDKAIQDSNHIFISIGGNNLNRIRNADMSIQIINFEKELAEHLMDLNELLSYIRKLNQDADIIVIGLYNPYGDIVKYEDLRLLQEWNYQTRITVQEFDNTNIIPLYDLFKNNLNELLSIDQFHPSGEGYELIAEMIYKILVRN